MVRAVVVRAAVGVAADPVEAGTAQIVPIARLDHPSMIPSKEQGFRVIAGDV